MSKEQKPFALNEMDFAIIRGAAHRAARLGYGKVQVKLLDDREREPLPGPVDRSEVKGVTVTVTQLDKPVPTA